MARIQDNELNAMRNILKTLEQFDAPVRERILAYVYDRAQRMTATGDRALQATGGMAMPPSAQVSMLD